MINERELIVLTDYVDSDENRELIPGDVGCVVYVHPDDEAYIVEFLSLKGRSCGDRHFIPVPTTCRDIF